MKLIALDMDGTVLTSDKRVTGATIQAIEDAKAAGHRVMICSGRAHNALIPYLDEHGLSGLPVSGSNGAVSCVDGEIIHKVGMDRAIVAQLFDWLDANQYPFKIYTRVGTFGKAEYVALTKSEFELAQDEVAKTPPRPGVHRVKIEFSEQYEKKYPTTVVGSLDEIALANDIFKIFVYTPRAAKKQAFKAFLEAIPNITVTSSYDDNVEVMASNGNKGTGLAQIAQYYQIPIENTVAIGDNFNDVQMLEVAGLSVAMGNAEEKVKEICDVTTLTNDEDGVAHAIREYVLKD